MCSHIHGTLRHIDADTRSNPHPFVSLITLAKGKKLLPRLLRNVAPARLNLFLTLIVACYGQLDVVRDAPLLDRLENTPQKREVERETEAFVASVVPLLMGLVKDAPLRLVSGLVGLLFEAGNLITIAQTKARDIPALISCLNSSSFDVAWRCAAHDSPRTCVGRERDDHLGDRASNPRRSRSVVRSRS